MTPEEAQIFKEWAKENGVPFQPEEGNYVAEGHLQGNMGPHNRIGPINHIPVHIPD